MRPRIFKIVFLVIFISAAIFQIVTTNFKSAYSFTPHEIDLQIKRMNEYPPELARMGHILEVRKEIQILEKVETNFFTVLDFGEYFPNRIPFILSPFLIIGFYFFVIERQKNKLILYTFIFSIILMTIIGSFAKYGPVLIMMFFIYFIILGFLRIFKIKKI